MSLPPGHHLGPYEIVALIGVGGMGEVYKARDTRLDRTVAIKVLPARVADDRESRDRLEREARAISALNHPHICTLHDVGRHEGVDFLVMEYTAAYMSPEQARGRSVDKRTDIWAFGCVCFEALTGRQAFAGESITDVLAAIVKNEPDWSALPAHTPAALRRTLARCLKKDRKERAHDIADVRLDLEEALAAPDLTSAQPATRAWGRLTLAAVVGVVGVLAAAASFVAGVRWNTSRVAGPTEWVGEFLGGSTVALGPVVSPDGKNVAFQAFVDNLTQVAVMRPETGNWQVLTRDRTRSGVSDMSWTVAWR